MANETLLIALDVAVPLRIMELSQMTPVQRERTRTVWASEGVDAIASQGDVLQYGSKKRGEAAAVFNLAAKGLAALAYQPGGVQFAGRSWTAIEGMIIDEA